MRKPDVMVIGLDPAVIDFSEDAYRGHPGLNAQMLRDALDHDRRILDDAGFGVELCMIDLGETACATVTARLDAGAFDVIAIGAGLRLNPLNTILFERIIDIVHRKAPGAMLCFNTSAKDTAECVMRAAKARRSDT